MMKRRKKTLRISSFSLSSKSTRTTTSKLSFNSVKLPLRLVWFVFFPLSLPLFSTLSSLFFTRTELPRSSQVSSIDPSTLPSLLSEPMPFNFSSSLPDPPSGFEDSPTTTTTTSSPSVGTPGDGGHCTSRSSLPLPLFALSRVLTSSRLVLSSYHRTQIQISSNQNQATQTLLSRSSSNPNPFSLPPNHCVVRLPPAPSATHSRLASPPKSIPDGYGRRNVRE